MTEEYCSYTLGGAMHSSLHSVAIDMQVHILDVFLATCLPTNPSVILNPWLVELSTRIDEGVSGSVVLFTNQC